MTTTASKPLTGVLETMAGFLMFCMPHGEDITPGKRTYTHRLEGELNVLRRDGRVFFWVPGTELKTYASETSLNVPERTTIGSGFTASLGKSLQEVLEDGKEYTFVRGKFAPRG